MIMFHDQETLLLIFLLLSFFVSLSFNKKVPEAVDLQNIVVLKHLCKVLQKVLRPAALLERDSSTGVFLRTL